MSGDLEMRFAIYGASINSKKIENDTNKEYKL